MLDNKWRYGGVQLVLPPLLVLLASPGIKPVSLILDQSVGPEFVLLITEPRKQLKEFEGPDTIDLFIRSGLANTSFGPVYWILFLFPIYATGQEVTYENIVNPRNVKQVSIYRQLAEQKYWHVVIADNRGEALKFFEFRNNYGLSDVLKQVERVCSDMHVSDFMAAKAEYKATYSIEELSEIPGTLSWVSLGQGVPQDYIKVVKWCRKAAEQGFAWAQYGLGAAYANGWSVPQDYAKALYWYRKAAKQGHAAAQYNLAETYASGQGVSQSYAEAAKWYHKAAEQGHAQAQYNLGVMYAKGLGVPQDYTKVAKWFRKAAKQGYAQAQCNLGGMYATGLGVRPDYTKALYWYRKAAEQGDVEAQYNLGVAYHNGQGVPQDYAKAAKWYRKAAEQGDVEAQYNLGLAYHNGQGVMRSYAAAADWLYKAGLSFLKESRRDDALKCVEMIKGLGNVPNAFLADELLAAIHPEKR